MCIRDSFKLKYSIEKDLEYALERQKKMKRYNSQIISKIHEEFQREKMIEKMNENHTDLARKKLDPILKERVKQGDMILKLTPSLALSQEKYLLDLFDIDNSAYGLLFFCEIFKDEDIALLV